MLMNSILNTYIRSEFSNILRTFPLCPKMEKVHENVREDKFISLYLIKLVKNLTVLFNNFLSKNILQSQ